jgi:hypothetical protein
MTLDESGRLWGTLYTLGINDGAPLEHWAVTRLFELGIAEMGSDGPRLTAYGEKCFVVMESGDGEVPELEPMIGSPAFSCAARYTGPSIRSAGERETELWW